MNGFNLSNIQDASLGTTQLSSIYLGSIKLWEPDQQLSEYFWIKCTSAGNMELTVNGTLSDFSIQISIDKTSWSTYTFNSSNKSYSFGASTNMIYYIKGTNSSYATSTSNYFNIKCTSGSFTTGGNIMSLICGDNFQSQKTLSSSYTFGSLFRDNTKLTSASDLRLPATTLASYCYYRIFNGCTSLTTVPELPATTLVDFCYAYMFEGCSSLTTAPELPATTLANACYMSMFAATKITTAPALPATTLEQQCYRNMFYGCTSLIYPPTLNATTLKTRCYQHMFYGCTSLTTAPELPATTLVQYCYGYMFQRCSSLSYIKCLATNISASMSHTNWLSNVASTGTFVKSSSMTSWPSGASGIPSSWTVVNV